MEDQKVANALDATDVDVQVVKAVEARTITKGQQSVARTRMTCRRTARHSHESTRRTPVPCLTEHPLSTGTHQEPMTLAGRI